jgi:iron-sulfur cluster repair protein YtfE (RIC family)
MLIKIGQRPGGGQGGADGDPVDSLLACHERIRSFLALGARLDEPGGDPAAIADACRRIERYFREAMPLHVADEEESIVPRLRGREDTVDLALAEMHDEHTAHQACLGTLIGAAADLAVEPLDLPLRAHLAACRRALEAELAPHLAREEAIILPAMRRLLGAGELADIADEIRARRGR